ncbi:hypothetical protein TNCV_1440671 [Trichonephila clavipes]|nr:hypothetical protein TNCV_1440671 [Trichonephila clavipes]
MGLDCTEWNYVLFKNESRFNFRSDDNRVRVWRPLVNASTLPSIYNEYAALTASVMVWVPLLTINGPPNIDPWPNESPAVQP